MKKITLALLSVLLITALGGCKSTTPQTADKNVKPALMWFDAEANFEPVSHLRCANGKDMNVKTLTIWDILSRKRMNWE